MAQDDRSAEQLFTGNSEMAMRMRQLDWSQTPLGAIETWPQSLRSTLSICLNSRFPIAIYWGSEFTLLYNDAWRPIVGDKHPLSLGRPAQEVWLEIWDDIGPELAGVVATGEGTFHNDELLAMHRFGYTEECFFEYTFNPIQGQGGKVDGVFNVVTETTYRVLSDRRARLLREVASRTGTAQTTDAACAAIMAALRTDRADIPATFLYLIDSDGKQARLYRAPAAAVDPSLCPEIVNLAEVKHDPWLIALATQTTQPQVIEDLPRLGKFPGSPWSERPQEAMVLPIAATGQGKVSGVLVAIASPRRRLDEPYCNFFAQLAGQIAMVLTNARAYEEERKRAEALAEIDRAKTTFFSNVSHEFRTPLTLILAPLEDAIFNLSPIIPAQEREQLQLVQRNGLRLLKLVNSLLDFSRIEAGRVQALYEPTDLAAFTAELASVFRSAIEQANLQFIVDCPPLSEAVYVDREMWEKIVLNLLSNAFKFTFEGEISIQLQWHTDRAELTVRDTGIGIPEAELPHLFERFHRVQGARGRTIEGSGIGLSLVQELVKLHGGTIEVTSVEGAGTGFTVSIPTGTAHLPQDRIGARTLASTALGAKPYLEEALRWLPDANQGVTELREELQGTLLPLSDRPMSARILLADDNADMRDYVKRLLGQQYEVEAVSDGLVALAAARHSVPDLILTDVMMPNLDGFGLLQALRSDPTTRETPIILLSARAGEEVRVEGLAAGADDYLIKPFSARELLARVEASLKLARLRREAGAAIRESEEKYRTLFESIAQGFCIIEMIFDAADQPIDYRFLIANPAFDQQTGTENAQGKTVREIAPQHEQYWFELYGKVALTGESIRFENEAAEFHRWYEVHAFRVGEPELRQVGVLFNDITDRQQAEEKLRDREAALTEAQRLGNIGSWQWDAKTDVITGSDQLLRIYGFDPERDTMPNLADQDGWYPHESWQMINAAVHQALETGSGYELDVQAFRNGTSIWITTRSEVLRDSDGAIIGLRGTVQDITERKQTELEREAAREAAEQANRVKDEFLAVLSHELRSPLNPILGWSKLLKAGNLDTAKTAQALNTIERNAKLQSELIEDLLDVSRILQGKLHLNVSPVNLATTIQAAIETVRLAAEAKSIAVETNLAEVGQVSGDVTRLQQVVWNLLSNAVKFTPEGGRVTVQLESVGSQAQMTVSDTGKGINPTFLPSTARRPPL